MMVAGITRIRVSDTSLNQRRCVQDFSLQLNSTLAHWDIYIYVITNSLSSIHTITQLAQAAAVAGMREYMEATELLTQFSIR